MVQLVNFGCLVKLSLVVDRAGYLPNQTKPNQITDIYRTDQTEPPVHSQLVNAAYLTWCEHIFKQNYTDTCLWHRSIFCPFPEQPVPLFSLVTQISQKGSKYARKLIIK
jgi:hypothetical protein